MIVSERLRTARTVCGFTQQQIADILGIDRSAYSYYETGRTEPSTENLKRLAALLKTDVAWLLGEDSMPGFLSDNESIFSIQRSVNEQRISELSDEEKEIIGLFRMLKGTADERALKAALLEVDSRAPDSQVKHDEK